VQVVARAVTIQQLFKQVELAAEVTELQQIQLQQQAVLQILVLAAVAVRLQQLAVTVGQELLLQATLAHNKHMAGLLHLQAVTQSTHSHLQELFTLVLL
jgi:hypothetical protein